jgi:hypothetical protein
MKTLGLLAMLQSAPSFGSIFAFLAYFVVFIVVCVIVILGLRWVMAKAGWTPDPTLMTILGLIVFLIFFFMFLALVGVIPYRL